ncbi:MAG: hypothetical protein KF841_11735 [Phycisphaerae bacterium]|nr:hypothetical protein [Phycisphaerae bacterium]
MAQHVDLSARLLAAADDASRQLNQPAIDARRIDDAITNAIDPRKLIDNFAEAWRTTNDMARAILETHGFATALSRLAVDARAGVCPDEIESAPLANTDRYLLAEGRIAARAFSPTFAEPLRAPRQVADGVESAVRAFLSGAEEDALGVLYRQDVSDYMNHWLATDAPTIDGYIRQHFGTDGPRYMINSGIGANEQFNYFVSEVANSRPDRRVTWLLANSPRDILYLPADATVHNTLFVEFSRSGITQETVKQHELTPRGAKRIVFANSGPLLDLAKRDGNLILELPSEVSGRYGRNKTPILMAPMYISGLDVPAYWATIDTACRAMPLSDPASLPVVAARYIRTQQLRRGINHIYLGANDPRLLRSADEFCQFWNEGVNRDGNDMTMSRYLGLPRDSHMNLEAILGTSEHKLAIFLLRTGNPARHDGMKAPNPMPTGHPLLLAGADAIDSAHKGLTAADVDLILALANVKRCSEKMPTLLITVDAPSLEASAWLGQLWADITLVYSRLIGVDAGSNPEVKAVRTRAAQWLADKGAAMNLLSQRS